MLEAVKPKSCSSLTADNSSGTPVAASTICEEISTVNTESSYALLDYYFIVNLFFIPIKLFLSYFETCLY